MSASEARFPATSTRSELAAQQHAAPVATRLEDVLQALRLLEPAGADACGVRTRIECHSLVELPFRLLRGAARRDRAGFRGAEDLQQRGAEP